MIHPDQIQRQKLHDPSRPNTKAKKEENIGVEAKKEDRVEAEARKEGPTEGGKEHKEPR